MKNKQSGEFDDITLTDDERLAISAVVHQGYYMPDVFATVERIIAARLTLAAVEAKRADPEFMERLSSRVSVDSKILARLGEQRGITIRPGGAD